MQRTSVERLVIRITHDCLTQNIETMQDMTVLPREGGFIVSLVRDIPENVLQNVVCYQKAASLSWFARELTTQCISCELVIT